MTTQYIAPPPSETIDINVMPKKTVATVKSCKFPIGTTVTLKNARDPNKPHYAGIITGYANDERYNCQYFATGTNYHEVPATIIRHPVRIDDGTAVTPGEEWVIVAITGSTDAASLVAALAGKVEALSKEVAELRASTTDALTKASKRLENAILTLAQPAHVPEECGQRVRNSLQTGVVELAPTNQSPAAPAPTQPAKLSEKKPGEPK